MKKKQVLVAMAAGCALILAGCSSSKKETEAPVPQRKAESEQAQETSAAAETEVAAAETEAAAEAAVETEAAIETAVETEAAAETAAETEAVFEVTDETEEAADVVPETEEDFEIILEDESEDGWETEDDIWEYVWETESEGDWDAYWDTEDEEDWDAYWETESEYDEFDYTETEPEIIPRPEYNVDDYLTIEDDDYKNIKVQVAPAQQVTDEEIQSEIDDAFYYLEDYDDLVVKKKEGTVAEGDNVNIDYVGKKDGEEFEGGSAEGTDLVIGSGTFIPGFEEGLIGKEIGSTVDLDVTFPENYGVENLNGAQVVFTVTINYVTEIPEITDEIAEKLSDGEFTTVDEYKESIREELQSSYDDEYKSSVTNAVAATLLNMYSPEELPQANIDYTKDMIVAQYIDPYAAMYGMSKEDFVEAAYSMTYDEFEAEELIPSATQSVEREVILEAIAEKEGITMTDDELQEVLQGYADQYGIEVEELVYGQDMGYVRANELELKVMNWLTENADVEVIYESEDFSFTETEAEAAAETEAETAASETESEA